MMRIAMLAAVILLGMGVGAAAMPFKGFSFRIPYDGLAEGTAPAELAALPRPAGAGGFVTVRDARFALAESGEPIRFWGTNLCFAACFPPHDVAERMARRLATLGINCVRFHHMDSRGYPGGIWQGAGGGDFAHTDLHPEALERLDYLVAQLKKNGVYADLNLHVSRTFGPADGFPKAEVGQRVPDFGKGVDLFYPKCIEEQKRYARMLLGHRNRYTGNTYADEPAVAMVEISNEDGLLGQWFSGGLDNLPQEYNRELARQWNAWLRARHGSTGQRQGEAPLPDRQDIKQLPRQTQEDWAHFLRDTETRFWREMRDYLKNELGVRMPITGSATGFTTPYIAAETVDFLDAHGYWQHPHFPGRQWDTSNWIVRNKPMVNERGWTTLDEMAGRRVFGLPFTVTEYYHPAPNDYRAEAFPLIGAYGSFQGWDGIFGFAYSHDNRSEQDHFHSFFGMAGDPVQLAFMPGCSALFREGRISAAKEVASATLSPDERLRLLLTDGSWGVYAAKGGADLHAWRDARLGLTVEPHGAPPEAPGGGAVRWSVDEDGRGTVCFSGPGAAGLVGFCSGKRLSLGPVQITPGETSLDGFCAVLLTTVRPGRYLITAAARCENQDMGWNEERTSVGTQWGTGPSLCEGVPLRIALSGEANNCRLFSLEPDGTRRARLDETGASVFQVGPEQRTLWYELLTGG
ncbi:MAG: hypothetical protein J7M08_06725 [Planctomycetes bacterium]|nr:hypothetical protein [Planctomycetota bacterium]